MTTSFNKDSLPNWQYTDIQKIGTLTGKIIRYFLVPSIIAEKKAQMINWFKYCRECN